MESRQRKCCRDRGALCKEDGDIAREYKAMHEENISSSWAREDVETKRLERRKAEEVKERWREKRTKLLLLKEGVLTLFAVMFLRNSPMDDLGSFGDSWGDLHGDTCGFSECVHPVASGVPVETDVSDSPSSVVVLGKALLSEVVETQSFLFPESVKRCVWKVKKT